MNAEDLQKFYDQRDLNVKTGLAEAKKLRAEAKRPDRKKYVFCRKDDEEGEDSIKTSQETDATKKTQTNGKDEAAQSSDSALDKVDPPLTPVLPVPEDKEPDAPITFQVTWDLNYDRVVLGVCAEYLRDDCELSLDVTDREKVVKQVMGMFVTRDKYLLGWRRKRDTAAKNAKRVAQSKTATSGKPTVTQAA